MKNKFIFLVLSFAAGAIIGAAIVWMLCCNCCSSRCSAQKDSSIADSAGMRIITVQEANTYFHTYMNHPDSAIPFKAFSINLEQFNAMKLIANGDTSVHGFRVYMGMDSLTPVRMVVGTGSPDKVRLIYMTEESGSAPCPWLCDVTSPIMN